MILVLPDVHGRTFWKAPCEKLIDSVDKIIFLGDYMDPYPNDENFDGSKITITSALDNFKAIIDFYNKHKDKVIMLYGNHDLPYVFDKYRESLNYLCRFNTLYSDDISDIFDKGEFSFIHDTPEILFTHAGLTKRYRDMLNIPLEEYNDFFLKNNNIIGLSMCSFYRGGDYPYGSIVWSDVREEKDEFKKQIFGHTWNDRPIITENFMMLDTGNAYLIDPETFNYVEVDGYGNSIQGDS